MSGTIWLIAEDETDKTIIEAILRAKKVTVRVESVRMAGKTGGISRLAAQLEKLIETTLKIKKPKDCIAVLYDADEAKDPQRLHQQKIAATCQKYKVKAILVHQTIESWLLADSGVCQWLKQKLQNWDEESDPKHKLDSLLKDNKKHRLSSGGRQAVIEHLKGDGDAYSPSMKVALKHLKDAPCLLIIGGGRRAPRRR